MDYPFGIRPATENDAADMIDMMIMQHGKLNPHYEMYDQEQLKACLRDKTIQAVVAYDDRGRMAGMICAGTNKPLCKGLEFFLLTVTLEARGCGLGMRMQKVFDRIINLAGYACTYMNCLTVDTISQKNVYSLGYYPTGLIPERYLFDKTAKNLRQADVPQRRSHLMMCKALGKTTLRPLYFSPVYRDFIAATYAGIGIDWTAGVENAAWGEAPASSTLKRFNYSQHGYCDIYIDSVGHDLREIMEHIIHESSYQSLNVFLSMYDKRSPKACEIMNETGGIFTGLVPLAGKNEYMVFHFTEREPQWIREIKVLATFREQMNTIKKSLRKGG